jgi:hypothetical protein
MNAVEMEIQAHHPLQEEFWGRRWWSLLLNCGGELPGPCESNPTHLKKFDG